MKPLEQGLSDHLEIVKNMVEVARDINVENIQIELNSNSTEEPMEEDIGPLNLSSDLPGQAAADT